MLFLGWSATRAIAMRVADSAATTHQGKPNSLGEAYSLPDVLIEDDEILRAENSVLHEQMQKPGDQPGQMPGDPLS
jgi:hypothetical protein